MPARSGMPMSGADCAARHFGDLEISYLGLALPFYIHTIAAPFDLTLFKCSVHDDKLAAPVHTASSISEGSD